MFFFKLGVYMMGFTDDFANDPCLSHVEAHGLKPKFDEICAFFQFFLSELCFIGATYPQLCSGTYLWHFCIFCDSHSLFVLSAVPSRKEIQIPMSFGFWWRFCNQHKGVFSQYKICFSPHGTKNVLPIVLDEFCWCPQQSGMVVWTCTL